MTSLAIVFRNIFFFFPLRLLLGNWNTNVDIMNLDLVGKVLIAFLGRVEWWHENLLLVL